MRFRTLSVVLLGAILLTGCGSGSSSPTAGTTPSSTTSSASASLAPSPSPDSVQTGSVVVDTTQGARTSTTVQFVGRAADGSVVYGPVKRPRTDSILLSNVPVSVVDLSMQYATGSVPIGSSSSSIVLLAGGTTTVPASPVVPRVPGLIVESNEGVQPVIDVIDSAVASLDVATTALSQSDVLAALKRAVTRGVKVRVLFGGTAPAATLSTLSAAAIPVVVKTDCGEEAIVADNAQALVMTLDLSDAPFTLQRDIAVRVTDAARVAEIRAGFAADFSGGTFTPSQAGLFWSPTNARARLLALIASTQATLDVETAQLNDPAVVTAMLDALHRGVRIRVVMSGVGFDPATAGLQAAGGEILLVNRPTISIHANMMISDGRAAFVGSQSLSPPALDVNRNLGVQVNEAVSVATLGIVFSNDYRLAKQVGPINPHLSKIEHIVVIFNENNAFDHLYGTFPGANGVANNKIPQVDVNGAPYATLPPLAGSTYPTSAPNQPFQIDPLYYRLDQHLPTPVHRFYPNIAQLNGQGYAPNLYRDFAMSMFVAIEGDCGPMGYWDSTALPMYPIARQSTLCDNFFTGTMGGSMFGAVYLVAAQPMYWPNPPASQVLQPVFNGFNLVGLQNPNGTVTPDGYVIEDIDPIYGADPNAVLNPGGPPVQSLATVGEKLTAANASWAWYSEGWDAAVAGNPPPGFTNYHIPFLYFQPYQPGQPARSHLQDFEAFKSALKRGTLPAVSYIKATDTDDEHSTSSTQLAGELFAVDAIRAVQNSSAWDSTVVILTYDDFGGFTDHVPPVMQDRWGPGCRLPCVIISPFARVGFVDSTLYTQSSILKMIEWRFGLQPLATRDASATNFVPNAFDVNRLVK